MKKLTIILTLLIVLISSKEIKAQIDTVYFYENKKGFELKYIYGSGLEYSFLAANNKYVLEKDSISLSEEDSILNTKAYFVFLSKSGKIIIGDSL